MRLRRVASLTAGAALFVFTAAAAQPVDVSGLNERYKDPDLKVEAWAQRFESEGREVFDHREEIVASIGLESGQSIADVGAGTGLFVPLFAAAVGPEGKVYAVDIAPRFIEHIRARAAERNLTQVTAILNEDRSTGLPEGSVDVVFICDTYHHFEYPEAMLASIHLAMRPGGRLVIVDFKREGRMSRHVRAGKEVFKAEIEENGFRFTEEIEIDGIEENYILHFERR